MAYQFCVITEVPPGYGPAFEVGELMVVGHDGREIGYPQRKPSKWDHLGYQIFDTVEEAAEVARRIYNAMLNKL